MFPAIVLSRTFNICSIFIVIFHAGAFLNFGIYFVADKAPSEASFKGTEYLTIDLSKGEPVLSTQESISLQFKTRQPKGLLFYSGKCISDKVTFLIMR